MKILHLTDVHGKASLIDKVAESLKEADLILISGDITHFGNKEEAKIIIEKIAQHKKSIYAIPGNCDYAGVDKFLKEQNMSLDKNSVDFNGISIIGMGGSLPCPGTTPTEYSEEIYKVELNNEYENISNPDSFILLIHQPPKNTKNDRVKIGLHVGSIEVRKFIEEKQPMLVLCGHIHEGRGVDKIGKSIIANPGSFREGKYGMAEINDNKVLVNLRSI